MIAVIFCGGYGTRLRSLNNKLPKPLVKVNGKEIILRICEIYLQNGIKKILLLTGYKHKYFIKNKKIINNKKIEVVFTGVGTETAERLLKVKKIIKTENFFLTYGDSLAEINLPKTLKSHKKSNKILSITFFKYFFKYGYFYKKSNSVIKFIEKKHFNLNSGFYVVSKKIFKYLKKNQSLEKDILPYLSSKNQINISMESKNWHPLDDKYDYDKMRNFLQND